MPNNLKNTETELIGELKRGSESAFRKLYDAYYHKVYAFAYRLANYNQLQTEDVVQSVFAKAWEFRDKIDPSKPLINYMCTIAKNTLLNEFRRQTLMMLYNEYSKNYTQHDISSEKQTDMIDLPQRIVNAVDKLPTQRRIIYKLSREEYLTNKEIAKRLNITESTVESQMNKALSFLRRELSEYLEFLIYIIIGINI